MQRLTLFFTLGRTTFVNTLCSKKVLEHKDADDAENAHVEEGVRIKPVTVGRSFLFDNVNDPCRLTVSLQSLNLMRRAPASP
jgi:septin family protein